MNPLLGNIGTGSCMLSSLDLRESKFPLLAWRSQDWWAMVSLVWNKTQPWQVTNAPKLDHEIISTLQNKKPEVLRPVLPVITVAEATEVFHSFLRLTLFALSVTFLFPQMTACGERGPVRRLSRWRLAGQDCWPKFDLRNPCKDRRGSQLRRVVLWRPYICCGTHTFHTNHTHTLLNI